jgi:hypothetical protein
MTAALAPSMARPDFPSLAIQQRGFGPFQSPESQPAVSAIPQADAELEQRIGAKRIEMEAAIKCSQQAAQRYGMSSCFGDAAQADLADAIAREAQRQFYELIGQRSPAQVARMEAAQAERMALEPGAPRMEGGVA